MIYALVFAAGALAGVVLLGGWAMLVAGSRADEAMERHRLESRNTPL